MQKISKVTRRNIFDLFEIGIVLDAGMPSFDVNGRRVSPTETKELRMSLYGRLDEIPFLERLFPLDQMPSTDRRYTSAREDIIKHTVANDDWPPFWIFSDERFHLLDCDDAIFLDFICTIFHPVVRKDIEPWKVFLDKINENLNVDGYELREVRAISGHSVYSWILLSIGQDYQEETLSKIGSILDSDYVRTQISEMKEAVEVRPYMAIGKAKELVETCCKSLLQIVDPTDEGKGDLPILFGTTCEKMGLAPNKEGLKETTHENLLARKILGNYIQIVSNMAELRNAFGDGHGRPKTFTPLPARYARLAVGSAITVVDFLLSTFEERPLSARRFRWRK